MDSLRFGPISGTTGTEEAGQDEDERKLIARNHSVVEGVVSGIAGYGNCFGVPNLGGETKFEPCYSGNPLVNAFALGLVRKDEIFYGKASGTGNPVIYVEPRQGATGFTARPWPAKSSTRAPRPSGPTCRWAILSWRSCFWKLPGGDADRRHRRHSGYGGCWIDLFDLRDGARGGVGLDVELDLVPQRETAMTAYEIMLSESQERMLLVATRAEKMKSSKSSPNGDWTR